MVGGVRAARGRARRGGVAAWLVRRWPLFLLLLSSAQAEDNKLVVPRAWRATAPRPPPPPAAWLGVRAGRATSSNNWCR